MELEREARPAPTPDEDSAFYWSGLAERRLLLQRCQACVRPRYPAMPSCPYCGQMGHDVVEASGAGTVHSWIVVHRAFHPAFAADVPYTVATVELEEGPRVVGWLEGAADVRPGLAVAASYVDHGDWTELRFSAVHS